MQMLKVSNDSQTAPPTTARPHILVADAEVASRGYISGVARSQQNSMKLQTDPLLLMDS